MKTNKTIVEKQANKSFVIKFIIEAAEIQKTYQQVLAKFQANFQTKGFRKGKAPLDVVENELSFEKTFEEVASKIISQKYGEIIDENKLKPIIQPQVKFNKQVTGFNEDWDIEITACELPEINLAKDYLDKINKIKADSKATDENQKTEEIIKSLISSTKVDLPDMLIDSDVQHQLSHLIEQTQQAGITVEQYLANQKTTIAEYQENLKKKITEEWTINLAIQQISVDQKLEVSQEEIKALTDKNPALLQNINMVNYLLVQQKVLEFLKK